MEHNLGSEIVTYILLIPVVNIQVKTLNADF